MGITGEVSQVRGGARVAMRAVTPVWALATVARWLVAVLVQFTRPGHGQLGRWPGEWPVQVLIRFDSNYFHGIATISYPRTLSPYDAFFPGYPLVIRLITAVVTIGRGGDTAVNYVAVLVSVAASWGAAVLVYRIAERDWSPAAAGPAATAFLVWPAGVFLSAMYSESLYVLLAAAAWWFARQGRWWLAGLCCAAASFTRVNGLFLLLALAVMYAVERARTRSRPRPADLAALGVGALGTVAFLVLLHARTGSWTAWTQAQTRFWYRVTRPPWDTLDTTLHLALTLPFDRRIQVVSDLLVVAAAAVAVVLLLRRRRWPKAVLVVVTLVPLVTSTYYLSVTRSMLTVFPLFGALGAVLARWPAGRARAVLALAGIWMLVVTGLFATGHWAG